MRETVQDSVKEDRQGYSVLQNIPGHSAQGVPALFTTDMFPGTTVTTPHSFKKKMDHREFICADAAHSVTLRENNSRNSNAYWALPVKSKLWKNNTLVLAYLVFEIILRAQTPPFPFWHEENWIQRINNLPTASQDVHSATAAEHHSSNNAPHNTPTVTHSTVKVKAARTLSHSQRLHRHPLLNRILSNVQRITDCHLLLFNLQRWRQQATRVDSDYCGRSKAKSKM